jgi:hypothetical protein
MRQEFKRNKRTESKLQHPQYRYLCEVHVAQQSPTLEISKFHSVQFECWQ